MPEESTPSIPEEAYRRAVEALDSRDFDAFAAVYSPDALLDASSLGLGIFAGREAIRAFYEDWFGAYEEWAVELKEVRDLGSGVTLMGILQRGRLPRTTGWVEMRYVAVRLWADGLIQRATFYADSVEARIAAEKLAEERG